MVQSWKVLPSNHVRVAVDFYILYILELKIDCFKFEDLATPGKMLGDPIWGRDPRVGNHWVRGMEGLVGLGGWRALLG